MQEIVVVFAAIYWFFLRGTAAGNAVNQLLHPAWTTEERRSLAPFTERTSAEIRIAKARVGAGLSRERSGSAVTY